MFAITINIIRKQLRENKNISPKAKELCIESLVPAPYVINATLANVKIRIAITPLNPNDNGIDPRSWW